MTPLLSSEHLFSSLSTFHIAQYNEHNRKLTKFIDVVGLTILAPAASKRGKHLMRLPSRTSSLRARLCTASPGGVEAGLVQKDRSSIHPDAG
jgi:hypothetical protein